MIDAPRPSTTPATGVVERVGSRVTHVAEGEHVALSWMPNCGLPLDRLITKSYELDQLNQAFADMREGKLKRGVVVFDDQLAGLCGQDDVVTLAA